MRPARLHPDLIDYRLPQPPAPGPQPQAFCLCPPSILGSFGLGQWMIYQIAFAQAQAVARPSLLERDLLAVWN